MNQRINETGKRRRKRSNEIIKNMHIACLETLPVIPTSEEITLKKIDVICQRVIASIVAIQLACDIESGQDYEISCHFFSELLETYGVTDKLLAKEKRLFTAQYTKQDVIDVIWTYETCWALLWALGLVTDMDIPNDVCDAEKAVRLISSCHDYTEFKQKVQLQNTEIILDMLDLYYRYHWACVEKRIHPETAIGELNPEVVLERRRGLEWLIVDTLDWNDISLDT